MQAKNEQERVQGLHASINFQRTRSDPHACQGRNLSAHLDIHPNLLSKDVLAPDPTMLSVAMHLPDTEQIVTNGWIGYPGYHNKGP
ncbi:MAG: hypothetical protein CMN05_15640 [Roseibacillus sp.]|nr:hypothetical protein [Roseibacillus sp.]